MALRTPLTAQPHLYIGDSTGRPLDYGRVYFGEPNKDPEFYPIDIYLDPEMTIAAAQPVRTKGGFMDVGGKLAELHAAEVIYSLKVLDQYGRQVFYKPEMYRNNVSDFLVDEITRATAAETLIAGNLTAETQRAVAAEKVIADAVVAEKDRAIAAEDALDTKHAALSSTINSLGGGKKAYTTYALMVADKPNIPKNSSIDVTNDTDPLKNGTYSYDGAVFAKSIYDVEAIVRTKVLNTFKTKSLMDASVLPDGADAQVTDDTVNNGLYVKTAGAWVKSAYNLYSNIEVDNKVKVVSDKTEQLSSEIAPISKAVKGQRGKALHQWVDADSNIVAEIDADAGLRLVGVEGTVQDALNSKSGNSDNSDWFAGNIQDLTHAFLDTDDRILMGIDKHSGLRLKGSNVSLQEQLNWRDVQTPHWETHPNEMFTAECDKYFTNMSISGLQNAPVPYGIMPQRYTVHDNIVNELTLPPPTTHYPIDTNYRPNDQVVHPYVCEFKGGFRGFRYLMSINPYFIESHENPVLFGSNDLHKWDLLEGFKQPLQAPATGHFFSDSGLTYDPINGMLVCYWRDGLSSGTAEEEAEDRTSKEQEVRYSATRDGIHWTEPKVMATRRPDEHWTSMTIVFNPTDGLFHLFTKAAGKAELTHYTSRTLNDNWELQSSSSMPELWHKEVKFVGDKYLLLVNDRDPLSNFYFAISSDGNTWTKGAYLFTEQQEALYKASFLPKFNEAGQIAFDILYTTNHTPDITIKRRFYHVTTNYVSI